MKSVKISPLPGQPDIPEKPMPFGGWNGHRLAALRLTSIWQLGARRLHDIQARWPDLEPFLDHLPPPEELPVTPAQYAAIRTSQMEDAIRLSHQLDAAGIHFILSTDDCFPDALRRQADPPFAIFLRGSLPSDAISVAVVGTRRMTDYGRRAAELLAAELARHGVTVVSGLAIGIDSIAHAACLDADGVTIAVLPGGIDEASLVPRRHLRLAKRIIETGSCLLSEHAPGTPVHPYHFLQRNRLIAALVDAVIVVEADRDSGALVTARLALEAGREVLAVPGSIWSAGSRGTNELIRHGARPCSSIDDVFAALQLRHPEQARQINQARATIPITEDEGRVLQVLHEPHSVDEVARTLGEPIAKTNATISLLELKGRVISVGPRTFIKTP